MLSNESSYLYLLGSRRLVCLIVSFKCFVANYNAGQAQDGSMDSAACLGSLGKSERGFWERIRIEVLKAVTEVVESAIYCSLRSASACIRLMRSSTDSLLIRLLSRSTSSGNANGVGRGVGQWSVSPHRILFNALRSRDSSS